MKTVRNTTRKNHKSEYLHTINYKQLRNETIYNKLQFSQYSPQLKRKFAFQQSGRGSKVTNVSVLRSSAARFCSINAKWAAFFGWADLFTFFRIDRMRVSANARVKFQLTCQSSDKVGAKQS